MSRIDELLSEHFYRFDRRGRGTALFSSTVALEPTFVPFRPYAPARPEADDGHRHTALSGLFQRLADSVERAPPQQEPEQQDEQEKVFLREPVELAEVQLSLSERRADVESLLYQVSRQGELLALELFATRAETVPQFVVPIESASRLERAVQASCPEAHAVATRDQLSTAWSGIDGLSSFVELSLGREFVIPLGQPRTSLLAGVATAVAGLGEEEIALFQVLIEPVMNPWAASMVAAVSDDGMRPFFDNRPDLLPAAKAKVSSPLFAVVVRLAAKASDKDRAWDILADMASPLAALDRSGSNYFVPSPNSGYPDADHESDTLSRLSRRSGMLLNMEEVVSLISPPAISASPKLRKDARRSRPVPDIQLSGSLCLGINVHGGKSSEVFLSRQQRLRHAHVIGASGTGKSTLLFNLIRQDIENGEGVAVLDPHGDLIDQLLSVIPANRIDDVVLIDPSDEEYSVGFNILSAHSDLEKTLLASDLVSVFERLSTSWGDQMSSVLQNAILAFLESSEGGTLADLRRFLLDQSFRSRFLKTVSDPEIAYYWHHSFPQLTGNRSVGPILTRLEAFLSPKPVRYMVSQPVNKLDFSSVMDTGKVFLAKLAQGLIGRENSYLLGSLIVSKFQQAAMSRQSQSPESRRDFWLYADEFQNFITPSMGEILGGTRKYGLGFTLAHQELRHLKRDPEVESAVLTNCCTRIAFRVGDSDARILSDGFSSFGASDLQSLSVGEAICRIERSDLDFNISVPKPDSLGTGFREEIVAASRQKYALPRADVESLLAAKLQTAPQKEAGARKQAASAEKPTRSDFRASDSEQQVAPAPSEPPPIPDSEKSVPPPTKPARAQSPADMGRGGAQHQAIQLRLKTAAEGLGFRAIVEKPILDGQGSVDLVLERPGLSIACEINVTSTIDYEVGNAAKCLKAGFEQIAVICASADRLFRLSDAIRGSFSPEQVSRIEFHSPDSFLTALQQKMAEGGPISPEQATESRRRGYKVKRRFVELSPQEARDREDSAFRILAGKLRKSSE